MSMRLDKLNLGIIGKPNSGKSTLFNTLLGEYLSPVGDEYGLTKSLYKKEFKHKKYDFVIVDTPGLRRRSKVKEKKEMVRNSEVIRLINNVDAVILLIDSLENITKQDFRLADLVINKYKLLFFIFNKIDIVEDKKKFKSNINKFLKNNYSKHKLINIEFISAKKNISVKSVLEKIITKKKLESIIIQKQKLNKFINYLNKKANYPKINKVEIKPKYIVQTDNKIPKFKVFVNTQKKTPNLFQKYFDNAFREYFKIDGIPIIYEFKNSKNPYVN